MPSLGPRANERPEVWRCTEPGPTEPKRARNHRSRHARSFERRQLPEEIRMCLKWSKLINTFLPFAFCTFSFFSAAHTFSPELAAKGKDPKLKCITEVARKVWNELDEGPPQTEIKRSLKVESCKIEMPHLMSMHNWMWNVGHCRCWGSLKRLLYHLPFLGIWQIIPSNTILSSLSSFPDCPRINHLHQNLPRDHGRRGFHPQWWKQPEPTSEASETSPFLKSPKHWWTPPRIWT